MTEQQLSQIRMSATLLIGYAASLSGYPALMTQYYASNIDAELQKIKAVLTEITKETEPCKQAAA